MFLLLAFVQPVHSDDPKTTKLQRLCEQATEVVESRIVAERKEGGRLLRTFNQFFGWERTIWAAAYPAEVLLYDQVLDTLVADVAAGAKGVEPLSKTTDSLVVHLTYGADCGVPPQIPLHTTGQLGSGAEIRPQVWSPNDCLVRQVDSERQQTRADVYATLPVRETATQREGRLFLFLSLSLTEPKPGRFQWDRLVKTQRFISGSDKAESQLSASSTRSR
jgi:hypothetical protein